VTQPDNSDWTEVRVRSDKREAIVDALFALGAEGVEERDREVVTHVRHLDRDAALTQLKQADTAATVEFTATPNVDWSSEWRTRLTAHRVGGLVITPPWLADQFTENERIVIEPGMAFGTGDHETTRGVMALMQRVIRAGDTVADLGAGSAVLAIAAAKLGATRAVAIEMDPDAIGNAEENIATNGVSDRCSILLGDASVLLPLVAPVRLVLANILANAVIDLLPAIAKALPPDGHAIVSGILIAERLEVERAANEAGLRVSDAIEDGLWWSATLAR
jgi:ribosomal protein L11 methyltransferase